MASSKKSPSENPSSVQRPLRPNPHLCEINTWAWLEGFSTQQKRLMRLADVPDQQWDALAAMGFDVIWLMGIWQRSPESRRIAQTMPELAPGFERALPGWKPEDVVGSPYSVAAYVPDPQIGTWAELDAVREKLRARGMALFLDFVGNHTARDHAWVREHPEYYVQGSLEDIINRALEKDRNLRYQNASDMRAELRRLKRDTESSQHSVAAAADDEVKLKRLWLRAEHRVRNAELCRQ